MKELFCKKLKHLRKQKEMSQEQLAQSLDITVQAVSKWECGLSYPDIETLLLLADLLEVTVDELLRDSVTPASHKLPELPPITHKLPELPDDGTLRAVLPELPDDGTLRAVLPELLDDGTLRVIQCVGNRIIRKDDYKNPSLPHTPIPLALTCDSEDSSDQPIQIEIWGSADIDGDIHGNVNVGDCITCGNIYGIVNAGDGVTCGNIDGNANAGDGITCGNIDGNADAGDCITCGNIDGNADAGDCINCKNIGGDVNAGDSIMCSDIHGNINSCNGDIRCNSVNGSINTNGDVYLENSTDISK